MHQNTLTINRNGTLTEAFYDRAVQKWRLAQSKFTRSRESKTAFETCEEAMRDFGDHAVAWLNWEV